MDINYYKKYEPIDGKWYLTKELGSGAFGKVFEIERRDFTNDKSALKIITIPSSSNEVASYREENYHLDEKSISTYFYGFVEEFTKEFSLMTQLKGENNIVRIEDYDVKEHENEIGWDIFIRMEILTPMNKYFARNNPTTKDVIKLGIDICKALEVCQKYNIVHRDIKPSNIFVSDAGEFKLGDFGVARTLEKTSSGLSKKGTYTYMAPEVYKGEAYGSNVDTYSLGIVMYKLMNNNMEPFKQGSTHEDVEKALLSRLKGEPMLRPANAEGKLAGIILKACAFNPQYRYESPTKMREELESLLEAESSDNAIFANTVKSQPESQTNITATPPAPETLQKPADETIGIFTSPTQQSLETEEKTVGIFDKPSTEETLDQPETTPMVLDVAENLPDEELKKIPDEPPAEKSSKSNKTVLWIIASVCIALLLTTIIVIWCVTSGILSKNTESTNEVSGTAAISETVDETTNETDSADETETETTTEVTEDTTTEETVKETTKTACPSCGSTEHSVHPTCWYCGSKSHKNHPVSDFEYLGEGRYMAGEDSSRYLVDENGYLIKKLSCSYYTGYSCGLARFGNDTKSGYIDRNGDWAIVIPYSNYRAVGPYLYGYDAFVNNVACVYIDIYGYNTDGGVHSIWIDTSGAIIGCDTCTEEGTPYSNIHGTNITIKKY